MMSEKSPEQIKAYIKDLGNRLDGLDILMDRGSPLDFTQPSIERLVASGRVCLARIAELEAKTCSREEGGGEMTDEATPNAFEDWVSSKWGDDLSRTQYLIANHAWFAATAHERKKVRELVEAVEAVLGRSPYALPNMTCRFCGKDQHAEHCDFVKARDALAALKVKCGEEADKP